MSQSQQTEDINMIDAILFEKQWPDLIQHIPSDFNSDEYEPTTDEQKQMQIDNEDHEVQNIDEDVMNEFRDTTIYPYTPFVTDLVVYSASTCFRSLNLKLIGGYCRKYSDYMIATEIEKIIGVFTSVPFKRGIRFCRRERTSDFSFFISRNHIGLELKEGEIYSFDDEYIYSLSKEMIATALTKKRTSMDNYVKPPNSHFI